MTRLRLRCHHRGNRRSPECRPTPWKRSQTCCTSAATRSIYLLRTGQLRSIKIGKSRRITEEHLAEFVASSKTATRCSPVISATHSIGGSFGNNSPNGFHVTVIRIDVLCPEKGDLKWQHH